MQNSNPVLISMARLIVEKQKKKNLVIRKTKTF